MAEDETNGPEGEVLDPNIRERLRQSGDAIKRAEEAEARAVAAERKSAFAEVGIPTSGAGKLFRDTYQGDPDPEAVKAAAEGYGILQVADAGVTDAEKEALQRMNAAGTGASPTGTDRFAAFQADIAGASSSEEVMARGPSRGSRQPRWDAVHHGLLVPRPKDCRDGLYHHRISRLRPDGL